MTRYHNFKIEAMKDNKLDVIINRQKKRNPDRYNSIEDYFFKLSVKTSMLQSYFPKLETKDKDKVVHEIMDAIHEIKEAFVQKNAMCEFAMERYTDLVSGEQKKYYIYTHDGILLGYFDNIADVAKHFKKTQQQVKTAIKMKRLVDGCVITTSFKFVPRLGGFKHDCCPFDRLAFSELEASVLGKNLFFTE